MVNVCRYTIHGWEGLTAPWFLSLTIRYQFSVHVFFTQDISLIFVWELFIKAILNLPFFGGGGRISLALRHQKPTSFKQRWCFLYSSKEIQKFVKVLRHSSDMNQNPINQPRLNGKLEFFFVPNLINPNSIVKSIYHLYTILPPVANGTSPMASPAASPAVSSSVGGGYVWHRVDWSMAESFGGESWVIGMKIALWGSHQPLKVSSFKWIFWWNSKSILSARMKWHFWYIYPWN